MKRLTHSHVMSLNTARLFLHKAFQQAPEPRFKKEIEADLERLDELKWILLHAIANPIMPFLTTEILNGPTNGKS